MKKEKYTKYQGKANPWKAFITLYIFYTMIERFNVSDFGRGIFFTIAAILILFVFFAWYQQDNNEVEVDVIKEIDNLKEDVSILIQRSK